MNSLKILNQIGTVGDQSDSSLLRRFLDARDVGSQAAFTALIERHGPMVQRVCRQILGNSPDADDAFQATFLVFVRKARSVRKADSVASWLHGVALRVANRSKTDATRRRLYELRSVDLNRPVFKADDVWPELHEELARLPSRYREAVVLCYLEGLSTEAAAMRLGCPRGTILSRLSRARDRLRERLIRRGLAAPTLLFTAEVKEALSVVLLESTARSALSFAEKHAVEAASASAITTLAKEMLHAMMMSKLKSLGTAALMIGILGMGTGFAIHAGAGSPIQKGPPEEAAKPKAKIAGSNQEPVVAKAMQVDRYKDLVKAQIALAQESIRILGVQKLNGRVSLNDPKFAQWERRLVEGSREYGYPKAEMIKILENYLENSQKRVHIAKQLKDRGGLGQEDVLEAEYLWLEAEMWLIKEKAR